MRNTSGAHCSCHGQMLCTAQINHRSWCKTSAYSKLIYQLSKQAKTFFSGYSLRERRATKNHAKPDNHAFHTGRRHRVVAASQRIALCSVRELRHADNIQWIPCFRGTQLEARPLSSLNILQHASSAYTACLWLLLISYHAWFRLLGAKFYSSPTSYPRRISLNVMTAWRASCSAARA